MGDLEKVSQEDNIQAETRKIKESGKPIEYLPGKGKSLSVGTTVTFMYKGLKTDQMVVLSKYFIK